MAREHETTAETYLVTYTIEAGEGNGMRLDLFLKEKYRKLSREYLQRNIRDQKVKLNHHPSKPSQILRTGDKVYVLSTRREEPEVDFNYKIIFEDEDILVVEKPGNLPVHPSGRYFFHTLLTQLRVENGNEVNQKKEFFLVHRIDRETSGILVMGKSSAAAAGLTAQFEKRETEKEYLAIVHGRVEKDSFTIDLPISSDTRSEIKIKMRVAELDFRGAPLYVAPSDVLPARTEIEVVERLAKHTVVRCRPHTGRQHQIRVHLDHVGHPIAGDKLYGVESSVFLNSLQNIVPIEAAPNVYLSRHALHAHSLQFRHPRTKEWMKFSSPFPLELDEFLQKVR